MNNTLVPIEEFGAITVFEPANIDSIVDGIREAALAEVFDPTCPKSRKACKSHARKVVTARNTLSGLAKDLSDDHYNQYKAITAVRIPMEKALDEIRDEVKKPVVDWENAELARCERHEAMIENIREASDDLNRYDIESIGLSIDWVEAQDTSKLEEFRDQAESIITVTLRILNNHRDKLIDNRDRDAKIAKLEAEAEERKAADAKAEKVANDLRIAQAKIETDKQRQMDEAVRIEQARLEAIDQERKRAQVIADNEKREREALDAQQKAEAEAAKLIETKRKLNVKHQNSIKNQAFTKIQAIIKTSESPAQDIVQAIAEGRIDHVTLNF